MFMIRKATKNDAAMIYQGMESYEFYVSEDAKGQISGLLIFNKELGEVYALYIAPWAVQKGLGIRTCMQMIKSFQTPSRRS